MKFWMYAVLALALIAAGVGTGMGLLLLSTTFDSLLAGATFSFSGIFLCFGSAFLVMRRMETL